MLRPTRFSPEVRGRVVRMVLEHQAAHDSQWAARLKWSNRFLFVDVYKIRPSPSHRAANSYGRHMSDGDSKFVLTASDPRFE